MTSCLRRLAASAAALVLASSAFAIAPHQPTLGSPDARTRLRGVPQVLPEVDAAQSKAWASADPAFQAFEAEAGVTWQARWDRRTARLSFAWGTFPAWLPATQRVRAPDERATTLAQLDARCRDLMVRHAGVFRLPASAELVLDGERSVALDAGRVWQVSYRVTSAGVPVEGAVVFFRINSGRLIQIGQGGLADELAQAPKTFRVEPAAAEMLGRAEAAFLAGYGDKPSAARSVAVPRLALLPWDDAPRAFAGEPGAGLHYRLAWRTAQVTAAGPETWVAWHDALTGERLALWDDNRYACPAPAQPQGRVVGGVYLGAIEEVPETLRGMPYTEVTNGPTVTTDVNGVFPYTLGQPADTSLSGTYFDMTCAACTNPVQAGATTASFGYLSLGTGGNDTVGNGVSTKAERNCFYHLNVVRQIAQKHLDDAAAGGFFSRRTPAQVNIGFTCNAFWDGNGVNFFRAGGGCNNTGEIADVMQHEWGHGLDQFTGGGADGARGEGLGDVVAFMSTHDARLGPYFVTGDVNGLRNADENASANGLMSTTTVGSVCPSVGGGGDGPLGYEVHCEGEIFSQAWWHLARNMRQKMVAAGGGDHAGWFLAEKLFFQSMPLSRTYVPTGTQPTYDAVMAVDDDNGNLADGTPNAAEINEAFAHHGMDGAPQVGDSADCAPPPAPTVTLTPAQQASNGLWQVHVQWTATPGAVEYRITRNQAGGAGADEPVATVMAPALDYFDDDVTDGVTYRYRVQAFLAPPQSCVSIADNQQQVTIAVLPNVVVDSWSFDDSAGNDNGFADPGETLVIPLTALNAGTGVATGVLAELTTPTPGVTIVRGAQNLGDLGPGASASTAAPHFAVALDRAQVACGQLVPFVVSFQATEGCSVGGFSLQVGNPPNPCEAPEPRPRLRFEGFTISDGGAGGGTGDDSGTAEPGEVVRLPVDVFDFGNAGAMRIRGTLSLVGGPPGTLVSDSTTDWPDLPPGGGAVSTGAPAHVEVTIPADAPCGSMIDLLLVVGYDGPSGSYALDVAIPLLVGRIVENVVLADDFETGDNGFTHGANCGQPGCDDWQRDVPTTASAADPPSAHSPTRVWGNDLGTLAGGGSNGEYRRNTINWLDSPPLDCSALRGTKLTYWRWLSVEQGEFDHARVQISTDGSNWITVWENPFAGDLLDTAWTYMEHDVSALVDGQPSVQVRFTIEADGGLQYGGWTIDDLRLLTSDVVCGNCSAVGAPTSPGGSLRATGVKSDTSAEFAWTLAGALQPSEEWRVYRGTAANDVTTLLSAPAFTGGSLLDPAAPGPLYFYNLVKANCTGAETP